MLGNILIVSCRRRPYNSLPLLHSKFNMTKKSLKQAPFEQALTSLETIVNQLEAGDLSLEESLKVYEQGVSLTRQCQQSLHEAEQKITILSETSNTTDDFASE